MRHLYITFFLTFISLIAFGKKEEVTIGIAANFNAMSDTMWNAQANYFRQGVELAHSDLKNELDKAHISIKFEEFNYGNEKAEAANIALKAVQSKAIAVIGFPYSSELLLAGPIFQENHLLVFSPSASADRIGQLGRFVRTCSFSDSFQGVLLSKFVSGRKLKKVAVVSVADCAYCQSLTNSFISESKNNHIEVVLNAKILENQVEDPKVISQLVESLAVAKPDVVFLPNYERVSATLISNLYDKGIHPKIWLGGDGWGGVSDLFRKIVGNRNVLGFTLAHWAKETSTSEGKLFLKSYEAAYHKSPDNDIAAVSYEAAKIVFTALLNAPQKTRKSLVAALEKVTQFKGLTGPIKYEAGTNIPEKSAILIKLEKGKAIFSGRIGK